VSRGYLYRRWLWLALAGLAVVVGLWIAPGASRAGRLAALAAGGSLGALGGYLNWSSIRRRVFTGNRVILFYEDSFTYAVLVQVGIASFFPRSAFDGLTIWTGHPIAVLLGLSGLAAFVLATSTVSGLLIRSHELRHGPLRAKTYYARSVTGREGMLGKRGVVELVRGAEATVRVASELWRARALDGAVLSVGEEVVVRDVEGLCLLVEAVRGEAS